MINTHLNATISGTVVGLQDGGHAIVVYQFDAGMVLLLVGGGLVSMSSDAIVQRPATCRCCGACVFWWHDAEYLPRCLACVPPDGEWRTETLRAAGAFADHADAALPAWFMSWLAAQDCIGPRGWALAQQFAFVGRIGPLIGRWYEEHL